jgi:hypothetical protein
MLTFVTADKEGNMKIETKFALQVLEGRQWLLVLLNESNHGKTSLSSGWYIETEENSCLGAGYLLAKNYILL